MANRNSVREFSLPFDFAVAIGDAVAPNTRDSVPSRGNATLENSSEPSLRQRISTLLKTEDSLDPFAVSSPPPEEPNDDGDNMLIDITDPPPPTEEPEKQEEEEADPNTIPLYEGSAIRKCRTLSESWPCIVRDRWKLWNDPELLYGLATEGEGGVQQYTGPALESNVDLSQTLNMLADYVVDRYICLKTNVAGFAHEDEPRLRIMKLPHIAVQILRVALNFIMSWTYAVRFDDNHYATVSPDMLVGYRATLQDVLMATRASLSDIIPSPDINSNLFLFAVTDLILTVIYPNALSTGKLRLSRAIIDFIADLAMNASAPPFNGDQPSLMPQSLLTQLMPSLDNTAAAVLLRLKERQQWLVDHAYSVVVQGIQRAALGNGNWPIPLESFDAGLHMTQDPVQSMLTLRLYLQGPRRAIIAWPAASNVAFSQNRGDTQWQISIEAIRAMHADGVYGGGNNGGRAANPQVQERMRTSAPRLIKTPLALMTDPEHRTLLPLCACSVLERGNRVGALKNEDRWWLTNFTKDTLGGETVDIEDLILGFSSMCRRNFGHRQSQHVRAQAARHSEIINHQLIERRPAVAMPACATMLTADYAYSQRRASACPFAERNAATLSRESVQELMRWQLGGRDEDLKRVPPAHLKAVLDGVDARDQTRGCLAHFNAMVAVRHGTSQGVREKRIVYPAHFVQLQAMRDVDNQSSH